MASESFELRRAVAADAAAIREVTRAAYAKWIPVIGREPKPMTADYDEAVRQNRFDLLFVEGKLAAVIETIAQTDSPSSRTSPSPRSSRAAASAGN